MSTVPGVRRYRLEEIFGTSRPIIGMVHLQPLPGSPGWGGSMRQVIDRALADADVLRLGGMHGLMVENYADLPFMPDRVGPETLAAISVVSAEVVRATGLPVGVNLLRNDALGAVAAAHAAGARFVRINVHTGVMATDQGLLTGRAHETLRLCASLGADIAIFADVWVKHATPFPGSDLAQAAEDTWERGRADALILSGSGTGKPTDLARATAVRTAAPDAPLLIGSGLTPETASEVFRHVNGAIVGSAVQRDGRAGSGVDSARVTRLMDAVRSVQ